MEAIDISKYQHSPTHKAVISKDYINLKSILSNLPKLLDPSEIKTESDSLSEESKSELISSIIDTRDVPNRDTPLHLAVKLKDPKATEMLMEAGADWTLQNKNGWNSLQEAVCNKQEQIATIIVKHYQPLAWAKWCRRLPRLISTMKKMKDFYLEINFHFESSVVPFISKVAPSDTYKVWKIGSNLRADMTMAGFDGFKIQRSEQSILFLGNGSEDGKILPGSLLMVSHKDKEVMNALDGASSMASEEDVKKEVAAMCKSNVFRPGIDVTEAVLFPQMNWRRQEKNEMIGDWKTKVYEMHNVVVSIKSRQMKNCVQEDEEEDDDFLTDEEHKQFQAALKLDLPEFLDQEHGLIDQENGLIDQETRFSGKKKKGWLGNWRRKESKLESNEIENVVVVSGRSSVCVNEKVSDLFGDCNEIKAGRYSVDEQRKVRTISSKIQKETEQESEYKKGLRPVLWLCPNFPLQTEELLPLLDILANKVKAIRRLRDLLTTKLPLGTFPVKVAIPVVPTIKVIVTFTKFEELEPLDEFKTPLSSPNASGYESPASVDFSSSSSSWFRRSKSSKDGSSGKSKAIQDPFAIPTGYAWVSLEAKKKKQEKHKSKKGKKTEQVN